MSSISFFFLTTLSFTAAAEYRAFELSIVNLQTGAERRVLTNFDPDQYRGLHPIAKEEDIQIVATWKCKGDTSNKPVCPNPKLTPPPVPKSEPAP